jgi:hypothetical protein
MDIVYPVKIDPENDSEELRYSLRSLKNIPHNRVVIVGEIPSWVRNVERMPIPQTGSKAQNVAANLSAVLKNDTISEDFILMNDDFFVMKPIETLLDYDFGAISDVLDAYRSRYPDGSEYIDKMALLYELLQQEGFDEPLSYELHVPMRIRKERMRNLIAERDGKRLYQFRSYYGNHAIRESTTIADVKIFLDPAHNDPEYLADPTGYMEAQRFLSATGGAFKNGPVGRFISEAFPDRSRYESADDNRST